MTILDPIIAVKDLETSSRWYQNVLGCKSTGQHLVTLLSKEDKVILCLHKWGEHDHPTMQNSAISPGNGLILYFRTKNLAEIRENVVKHKYRIDMDIHLNPNSGKKEFSLRDPDGYYLTISEFHTYGI